VLDLKLIRDNPDIVREVLVKRMQVAEDSFSLFEKIKQLEADRRRHISSAQDARTKHKHVSNQYGKLKKEGREDVARSMLPELERLKNATEHGETIERAIVAELHNLLAEIPNIPAEDVPVGGEAANTELRSWGIGPKFDFSPKQHFELGEALGLMDFETASKLSGSRFVVLKGALARMERAIATFMLDLHTNDGGYTEISTPSIVRSTSMFGTAQLPKFRSDLFDVENILFDLEPEKIKETSDGRVEFVEHLLTKEDRENIKRARQEHSPPEKVFAKRGESWIVKCWRFKVHRWLIPTSEVPLTNLVAGQIVAPEHLPIRVTAHTPCFRAEAGAAGKDTRGMIRLHQFSKVELVSITTPEQSAAEHERMTACAEEVLKRLGLAYRTIVLATGDMGFSARKTYDIEVWLPGQNAYREISSCSNCGDFQARRMDARYRPKGGKDVRFVHTLNGSGLAVGRTLIAVMENYQQADGSIRIPDALVPYMGGMTVIPARG
jgi:seryl-tRNA synthetase